MKKSLLLFSLLGCLLAGGAAVAQSTELTAPAGSGQFGRSITVLTNGNYVVTDPSWDNGAIANVGAVYLYNGQTHALISTLTGSQAGDQVGSGGVTALTKGNYVVSSQLWDNGTTANVGAVTWGSSTAGVSGVVSSSNSLVGGTASDQVGFGGVTALSNGNYVVSSRFWDNGTATDVGAVTWGSGTAGIVGVVSGSNSLVGSKANDQVGGTGVFALPNGNYVVRSENWDNGTATDAGAVTWGSGTAGVSGVVSSSNSLVGSKANDQVGRTGVTALTNGNYVVSSSAWDNATTVDVGAVTWCDGITGRVGAVSSSNSLVGSSASDGVGFGGVTALSNGNYVVRSQFWDNGATATDAGAVTWGSGTAGVSGVVSSSNSLVGSRADENVGSVGVIALTNGNYVVSSPNWGNGTTSYVGAVTWGSGTAGVSGEVSSSNSLVGSTALDNVGGSGVTALSNGNYVVSSTSWDNGATSNVGAVTWGSGTAGLVGVVSSSNSLFGSSASDGVGNGGVTALSNGNYVVRSTSWDNGAATNAGAVTWGSGTAGVSGAVSSSNSLVGSTASDNVGSDGVTALSNGNYVVRSLNWDNSATATTNAGAVTWGSGTVGVSGVVSSSNSLVGSTASDQVGNGGVTALTNGNYVVSSQNWDNGTTATNAGAVTWGSGTTGVSGVVSSSNSLVGSTASDNVGNGGVTALTNGNYVVRSPFWDNGAVTNAGAVSFGMGTAGLSGTINSCNSVRGIANSDVNSSSSIAHNTLYGYSVVGLYAQNKVYIFKKGTEALATTATTQTLSIAATSGTTHFIDNACNLIASVTQAGASPIAGSTTAKVWIDGTQDAQFVKRHFEITPASNASTATGKVTLYFTQAEFDAFNGQVPAPALLMPANPTDNTGIANLKIEKREGTSSDGTGNPSTYSGSPTIIDPTDTDIVWNSVQNRWEVSFDVTGFGGFWAKTQNTSATTLTLGTATNPSNCTGTPNGSIAFTSSGYTAGSQTLTYKKDNVAATPATVTIAADGSFTLTGLGAGVYSDFAIGSTAATGNRELVLQTTLPQFTVRSNSPQCERSGLSLESSVTFSFDPSVNFTYAWTGPNGFTAATANATISSLLPINAGTYNLQVTNTQTGCSDTKSLTVVVFPLPAIPTITASSMQLCKGESVLLTGTCSATTDIFRWTTPPLLGNSVASLSNINQRTITTPGVYKGLCESKDGCTSDEVSINITERSDCSGLNFITVTPSKTAICPGGSVLLTASGCAGGTLTWIGGAAPQTGTSITASPTATTIYIVQCSTGGSGTVDVVVAQPTVAVPNNIVTGQDWIKATQTITSDKKIGDAGFTPAPSVLYEAGSSITLLPGFVAEKWSTFKAEIKGCN